MSSSLQRLWAEIWFDCDVLARRVDEHARACLSADREGTPQRTLTAVALHHASGSLVRIMVRVARYLEGDIPAGGDWLRDRGGAAINAYEGVRALFAK